MEASTWFLILLFKVGGHVIPMENLEGCEIARQWIMQNHWKDMTPEKQRLQADRRMLCVPHNKNALDQLTPELRDRWLKRLKRTPTK